MNSINFETYFKRLLMMNSLGVYVTHADGHNWIELDEECDYHAKFAAVCLNNKIYGGVLEAIDTFDAALIADGQNSLMQMWENYGQEVYMFRKIGADMSRIEKVANGQGGIF